MYLKKGLEWLCTLEKKSIIWKEKMEVIWVLYNDPNLDKYEDFVQ